MPWAARARRRGIASPVGQPKPSRNSICFRCRRQHHAAPAQRCFDLHDSGIKSTKFSISPRVIFKIESFLKLWREKTDLSRKSWISNCKFLVASSSLLTPSVAINLPNYWLPTNWLAKTRQCAKELLYLRSRNFEDLSFNLLLILIREF